MKKTLQTSTAAKPYALYLCFMLLACCGAFLWQFFLSQLGGKFTSWGDAPGWQREIALWNVALIVAIAAALVKKDLALMKLLTLQSTVLCWVLGVNHFVALVVHLPKVHMMHLLGVLEVMLLGGVWGLVVLVRGKGREK